MLIKNNKGPNMLPWGIPLITSNQDDCSPSKITHCFLLHKKSVTQLSKFASILYNFNLSKSLLCGTVSNACALCIYITSICPPESNCLVQSSIIFKSCRAVDLPLIKPYCLVLKVWIRKEKVHNLISNYWFHQFTYNSRQIIGL